jgi:hypothetical protein
MRHTLAMNLIIVSSMWSFIVGPAVASDSFPKKLRGYWAVERSTCDELANNGVAMIPPGKEWLKISSSSIFGDSTMGKVRADLVEVQSKPQMLDLSRASFSAIIQSSWTMNGDTRSDLEHLALSKDGKLYETIQGARASTIYIPCD